MAPSKDGQEKEQGRLRSSGGDAVQLVIDYVRQETLDPVKGVGKFLLFGLIGSLALCVGFVLLLVGLLRALQAETGTRFGGHLSWLPYAMVGFVALVAMGLMAWLVTRGPAKRRRPKEEGSS